MHKAFRTVPCTAVDESWPHYFFPIAPGHPICYNIGTYTKIKTPYEFLLQNIPLTDYQNGGSDMKKRLLSILLVLCMVLTLVPTTALAATDTKTPTGSNVSFTISGDTYLCGRKGHTGTVEQLLLTDVDISAWDKDHKITVAYELTYSCSETSCPQHPGDGAEQRKIGTYTFTDADLCHKKVNETIRIQQLAANDADDSVTLQLTSDTSLSQVVFHAQSTPYAICTESYYTMNCWECTGCD